MTPFKGYKDLASTYWLVYLLKKPKDYLWGLFFNQDKVITDIITPHNAFYQAKTELGIGRRTSRLITRTKAESQFQAQYGCYFIFRC